MFQFLNSLTSITHGQWRKSVHTCLLAHTRQHHTRLHEHQTRKEGQRRRKVQRSLLACWLEEGSSCSFVSRGRHRAEAEQQGMVGRQSSRDCELPDLGHLLSHLLVEPDTAPRAEQPKVPWAGDDGEPPSLPAGDNSGLRSEVPPATDVKGKSTGTIGVGVSDRKTSLDLSSAVVFRWIWTRWNKIENGCAFFLQIESKHVEAGEGWVDVGNENFGTLGISSSAKNEKQKR
jgi:hypothetical protein